MTEEITEFNAEKKEKFTIDEEDWEVILKAKDPIETADKLGYPITTVLVTKIMIERPVPQMNIAGIFYRPYPGVVTRPFKETMLDKVRDIFKGHEAEQIALAWHYKKAHAPHMKRKKMKHERNLSHVKTNRYLADLIRYTRLLECGNISEIKSFRLSDEDEKIRREVLFGPNGGY